MVRMLEYVKLTEDEHLLVTEGIELHQALINKLATVPTPTGLTPHELESSHQGKAQVIHRRLLQVERILQINELHTVTKEVVEAARENLVIGLA